MSPIAFGAAIFAQLATGPAAAQDAPMGRATVFPLAFQLADTFAAGQQFDPKPAEDN